MGRSVHGGGEGTCNEMVGIPRKPEARKQGRKEGAPLPTEKFASDTNGGVDLLCPVAPPQPRVESDAALTEGAPEEMKRGRASLSSSFLGRSRVVQSPIMP